MAAELPRNPKNVSQWDSKGMHPFGGGAPPKKRKLLGNWFGGSASKKK
jgi:hypothetical protein